MFVRCGRLSKKFARLDVCAFDDLSIFFAISGSARNVIVGHGGSFPPLAGARSILTRRRLMPTMLDRDESLLLFQEIANRVEPRRFHPPYPTEEGYQQGIVAGILRPRDAITPASLGRQVRHQVGQQRGPRSAPALLSVKPCRRRTAR